MAVIVRYSAHRICDMYPIAALIRWFEHLDMNMQNSNYAESVTDQRRHKTEEKIESENVLCAHQKIRSITLIELSSYMPLKRRYVAFDIQA